MSAAQPGVEGMISGAVGGAIGMGVDAHVRNQNWSRQKRVMQEKYQWMVRDLKAAGLNPVLAATGGLKGASLPAMSQSSSGHLGSSVASGLAAGATASKASSEIAKNRAVEDAATAQSRKANEEALNAKEYRPYIQSQAQRGAADAESARINVEQMRLRIPEMEAIAEMWANPVTRKLMQSKEFLQGTPVFNWNPNKKPSGDYDTSTTEVWDQVDKNGEPIQGMRKRDVRRRAAQKPKPVRRRRLR